MPEETIAVTHNLQDTATEDVALLLNGCLEQAHDELLLLEASIVGDTHLLSQLNEFVPTFVF
ncbi:hypothetical protein ES703_90903 [subsurface metagenome]